MQAITKLIFIFCIFLSQTVYATAADDVTRLLNAIHTMQANFTQTIYDNHQRPIQKSYGQMQLQRPGKFRWNITKPMPQLIIANQSRIWIYDPDLQQVTVRTIKHVAGEAPALLLSQVDHTLSNEYDVSAAAANNASNEVYTLIPKKSDNMFTSIEIKFVNKEIKEMRLQDNLGHTTKVDFQQIKMNAPIASSQFIFKAPANTDVVNEA